MDNIKIQPTQITQNINNIKIDIPYIVLNSMAVVRVLCYDIDDNLLITHTFELTQPDYNIWRDDNDLINYVCQKYGFQQINNNDTSVDSGNNNIM